MKKIMMTLVASAFAVSAYAADYPQACVELEDLAEQMSELSPEMAAAMEEAGTEEERKEVARKAFAEMSAEQQEQAAKDCEMAVEQMEQLVEAMKAQG